MFLRKFKRRFLNPLFQYFKNLPLRSESFYRLYLKRKGCSFNIKNKPVAGWYNSVLKSYSEIENATMQIERLGLCDYPGGYKNWDTLAAVSYILGNFNTSASILDAGSSPGSTFLPSLYLYGYRNLIGINLDIKARIFHGPIMYHFGDITNTKFKNDYFDAVFCQSVIEHGVNIERFFNEMSRIITSNGALIISTDYWCEPIDTKGKCAYGVPIKIFSKNDIQQILYTAKKHGFSTTENIGFECFEKVVTWEGLTYTFIMFTLINKK